MRRADVNAMMGDLNPQDIRELLAPALLAP
jgi:hypothetical protein